MNCTSGNTYEIDMCSSAILPELLQFTLPLMFSSILQLLFNVADIILAGNAAASNIETLIYTSMNAFYQADLSTVMGNLAVFFEEPLLSIYTDSPAVIAAGMNRRTIICATYALCGISYSVMPMLVSLVGACGVRILTVATIFQLPAFHTIQTVYWAYLVCDLPGLSVLFPVGHAPLETA